MNQLLQDTLDALKHGVTDLAPQDAVKNVEAWQDALKDVPGTEELRGDLDTLKGQLDGGNLKDAVTTMQKVGVQITLLARDVPNQDDKDGLLELTNALNSPNI